MLELHIKETKTCLFIVRCNLILLSRVICSSHTKQPAGTLSVEMPTVTQISIFPLQIPDFHAGLHWGRKLHNGGAVVSSVWASLGCSLSIVSLKVFVWSVRLRKSNINTAPCTEHLKKPKTLIAVDTDPLHLWCTITLPPVHSHVQQPDSAL